MGFFSKLFSSSGIANKVLNNLSSKTIVVCDSSVTIQKVVQLTFEGQNSTVCSFSDSTSLFQYLESHKPDCILVSSNVPPDNGYNVSLYIKSHSLLHDIPVFIFTPPLKGADKDKLSYSKADGTIAKPFNSQLLLTTISDAIK